MVSSNDYMLESDVEVERIPLTAVVDAESAEDQEVLGYAMIYTVGEEFLVPREWLKERMDELGLQLWMPGMEGEKEAMLPPEVTPKRAFNRVRKYLIRPHNDEYELEYAGASGEPNTRELDLSTKKVDTSQFHLHAETWLTPEEVQRRDGLSEKPDEGEWRQATLGVFHYVHEEGGIQAVAKVSESDPLFEVWEAYKGQAFEMFETMLESHIGKDIQKMLYKYTHHWTESVKLRDGGAVYFVPAQHQESLDAMKTLVNEIQDKFKTRGRRVEIQRIPVVNSEEQREMVRERVLQQAREEASSAVENAFDRYEEQMESGEEILVDDIVDVLAENLRQNESFVENYNALLEAELDVRDVVESWLKNQATTDAKDEIVQSALEEADL